MWYFHFKTGGGIYLNDVDKIKIKDGWILLKYDGEIVAGFELNEITFFHRISVTEIVKVGVPFMD